MIENHIYLKRCASTHCLNMQTKMFERFWHNQIKLIGVSREIEDLCSYIHCGKLEISTFKRFLDDKSEPMKWFHSYRNTTEFLSTSAIQN